MEEIVTLEEAQKALKKATEEFYDNRASFRSAVVQGPIGILLVVGIVVGAFFTSEDVALALAGLASIILMLMAFKTVLIPSLGRALNKSIQDVAHWQHKLDSSVDLGWIEDHYFTGELPDGTWWTNEGILTYSQLESKVIDLLITDTNEAYLLGIDSSVIDKILEENEDLIESEQWGHELEEAESAYTCEFPDNCNCSECRWSINDPQFLIDSAAKRAEKANDSHDAWNSPRWREGEKEKLPPVYVNDMGTAIESGHVRVFAKQFGEELNSLAITSPPSTESILKKIGALEAALPNMIDECYCGGATAHAASCTEGRKKVKAQPNLAAIEGTPENKAWRRNRNLRPKPTNVPQNRPGAPF